tara:strand:- start:4843 stop:5808 length:966 start_codon:yes stop_codon:yes gene_type:complete
MYYKNVNIIVTGSSGFIGYHLVKKLLRNGHNIIGVDDNNDHYNPALKLERLKLLSSKNFKFYECDINAIDINNEFFDLAINLAAQPGVRICKSKEYLYQHTNVNGFKKFCNFCIENNIDKVIYASSSSVYADSEKSKFNESTTPLKPKSLYGKSKLANEIYANELASNSNIKFLGLRFFSVYGPFGRPDMAYYSFANSIKNKNPISLNNGGSMYRDMTYIDDIIDGILGSIDFIFNSSNKISNEIFNLGNNQPIKTTKLLNKIEYFLGEKTSVLNNFTCNESFKTHADIEKARNLLGYNPKVFFDEGIEKFLEWYIDYEHK